MFQVILCRLRCKLSLRDLLELFLLRGFSFTHEAVLEEHYTEDREITRRVEAGPEAGYFLDG